MAKKNREGLLADLPFYQYLFNFYRGNRKKIRANYKTLTRKFLDYNNPQRPGAFLRQPQYEALEMYVFLKEYLDNEFLYEIFNRWSKQEGKFQDRNETGFGRNGQDYLFEAVDKKVFEKVFEYLQKFKQVYPNYIFALSMGIGKTILMATCIFYEFLLANKYPKDIRFCHNALVFAPDKTVLQSLKEIQTFDKSQVVPPEYVNWLETHLKFYFLDDSGISLNLIENSNFNIIISNTQKIILRKKHKDKNAVQRVFSDMDVRYKAKSLNKEYNDLYDFDIDNETDLLCNERFSRLIRLKQLGIYVDEAHHAFGSKLEKDLITKGTTSLRLTINELAANLKEAGSTVVGCFNYTGTPYVKNMLLPEVVYTYGLKEAINNRFLKQARVHGFGNIKSKEFLKVAVSEFWEKHKGKRYENMLPKIALFASTIDELQQELLPGVENVLTDLGVSTDRILVNVGDPKLTSNDDLREFINLDTPISEKQFILLVNKGKEGWNCRSLFAVGLYRKPKSKVFVLQATMRCLRSIGDIQETADVYLSNENKAILQAELEENFKMKMEEMNPGDDDKMTVEVRPVPPPVKIQLKKVKKLNRLIEKNPGTGFDLELDDAPIDRYNIIRDQHDIKDLDRRAVKTDFTHVKEKRVFSSLTITAEISRYLNKSCLDIERVLSSSKEGMDKIIEAVNEYNELLYDWIIPKLFSAFYKIEEYINEEVEDIELIKPPKDGSGYFRFRAKPELVANISSLPYSKYKSKSFHLDNYCFDSIPEKGLFINLLKSHIVEKAWFTGMLTHGQTGFSISYIDPETHILRNYHPDFLILRDTGEYWIIEVKGPHMIDDAVVKAKAEYAMRQANTSGMHYLLIVSTDVDNIEGYLMGKKEKPESAALFPTK